MSVYGQVATEINDMELLCATLDEIGISYVYDPEGRLSYHKWRTPGKARGKDATLVIGRLNGGLDTTPMRYCGDTAFVKNDDGTFRVEIDIAHGNAPQNWQAVQNVYAAKLAERSLPRDFTFEYSLDRETGHVTGKVIPVIQSAIGGLSRGGLSR